MANDPAFLGGFRPLAERLRANGGMRGGDALQPTTTANSLVALTLRVVCGLSTEEIARAFLVDAPTMAQRLVPLEAEDHARWDHARSAAGLHHLGRAMELGPAGPYTVQAAIASLHARAPVDAAHRDALTRVGNDAERAWLLKRLGELGAV